MATAGFQTEGEEVGIRCRHVVIMEMLDLGMIPLVRTVNPPISPPPLARLLNDVQEDAEQEGGKLEDLRYISLDLVLV